VTQLNNTDLAYYYIILQLVMSLSHTFWLQ